MSRNTLLPSLAALCLAGTLVAAETPKMTTTVDWKSFLSRHDMVWTRLPKNWLEAPFLGNGMMGTMVRQTDDHTVRWDVGRGDVQDHRPLDSADGKVPSMYSRCRLPIGFFELKTVGTIKGGTMRLDLWNAEATGVIETDKGSIRWRSLVHANRMVILTELEPTDGERGCHWVWNAEPAVSPRFTRGKQLDGYKENPPPVESTEDNVNLCTQPLLSGGQTATAWQVDARDDKRLLIVSVAHSFPATTANREAVGVVQAVRGMPLAQLIDSHRAWWHEFYPQSFLSIPDTRWESFYWIQMYKLASATRADGMCIDNQGPWLQPTPWPGIWWNLNVQLTYWPTYASNRLGLGASLGRHTYANTRNLIDTVPEKYRHDSAAVGRATGQDCAGTEEAPDGKNAPEMGLLLWSLHNCWLHYRYSMDEATLREQLFPLLKRAVNYYFHFLTSDEKGVLHLPHTFSPEYKAGSGPDTNFDLALLRWGCTALIESCRRLGIDDPLLPKWRATLEHLTDYPTNENGYMIARGVPFATRHRHFSHLLMIYPLHLINVDQPGDQELALKSVAHWQSFGVSHGYSVTGASSMSSAFGHGNDALRYLNGLTQFLSPTTMYSEAGGAPVIETPLSGAQCIHDLLIQSWGGTIRVFPAVADAWRDVVFQNLRTEGAFLVSARRAAGKTQFVRVESLAGEPCRIRPGLAGKVQVSAGRSLTLKELTPGLFELDLKKNETAVLWSGTEMPELVISPVSQEKIEANHFGLK